MRKRKCPPGLRQKGLLVKMSRGGRAEDKTQDGVSHLPGKQNRSEGRRGESTSWSERVGSAPI